MLIYYDGISLQNKRSSNMDSLLLKSKNLAGQELCLAVVCDGVGSLEHGALASSLAIRMLSAWFDGVKDTSRLGLRLRNYVFEIHQKITNSAEEQQIKTATTLSALLICGTQYFVIHTGDSRVYSLCDGALERLTKDQSYGGKLTSCLGHEVQPNILYNEGALSRRRFLLCTDGLYKRVEESRLCAELAGTGKKRLRKTVEHLAEYAVNQGERDNISLAIVLSER